MLRNPGLLTCGEIEAVRLVGSLDQLLARFASVPELDILLAAQDVSGTQDEEVRRRLEEQDERILDRLRDGDLQTGRGLARASC